MVLTALCLASAGAEAEAAHPQPAFDRNSRSRGVLWGWGHTWRHGWPGYGHTETDVAFAAFHPQMGWFASDRLELYGEGTLLVYYEPQWDVSAGLVGIGGRYHLARESWAPYLTLGGGLIWTSLDHETAPEIDRAFNFQVIWGAGLRRIREGGPGWLIEVRNHHISNAGTAGRNLGINAITLVGGFDWVLRR